MVPGAKPTKVQVTSEGLPHTKHNADERGFPHFYPKTYVLARGDVNQKQAEAEPGYLQRSRASRAERQALEGLCCPQDRRRTSMRRICARKLDNRHRGRGRPAGCAGDRQPALATSPWPRNRRDAQRFRRAGRATFAPRAARLAGLAVSCKTAGTLKRLHKMIVTSAVYMQDSRYDEARAKIDRENVFCWRFTPRRLEAEPIRDTLLALSGRLRLVDVRPGHARPQHAAPERVFLHQTQPAHPIHDAVRLARAPWSVSGSGRSTTTAPQALLFMNSQLGRDSATGLASQVDGEPGPRVARFAAPTRLRWAGDPTRRRRASLWIFWLASVRTYAADNKPDPARQALIDFCQALLSMSECIYIQ